MKKIKLMHIILDMGTGGVEKFLLDLVIHMDKDKFDLFVVSLTHRRNSFFEKELDEQHIRTRYFNTSDKVFDFNTMFALSNLIKQEKPDIVNLHTYVLKMSAYALWRNHVKNIVHTIHVPPEIEMKACSGILIKQLYQKLNIVPIAVSKTVQKATREVYKTDNVKLIYNGIDLDKFKCIRQYEHRDELTKFINISRFMPEKNHELLVRAFAGVAKTYPKIQLSLIGSGRLKKSIEALVKELKIEEKVIFYGARSDVAELLKEHDIFVLSSNYEGFGLVLAEAMASGLPVLSTDVGAVRELIGEQEGVLVEKNNLKAYVSAMIYLLKTPKLLETYGIAGQKKVSMFSLANTVMQYENLYESFVGRNDEEE